MYYQRVLFVYEVNSRNLSVIDNNISNIIVHRKIIFVQEGLDF